MLYRISFFFHNLLQDERKQVVFLMFQEGPSCIVPKGETACDLYFPFYSDAVVCRSKFSQEFPYITPSEIVQQENVVQL